MHRSHTLSHRALLRGLVHHRVEGRLGTRVHDRIQRRGAVEQGAVGAVKGMQPAANLLACNEGGDQQAMRDAISMQ